MPTPAPIWSPSSFVQRRTVLRYRGGMSCFLLHSLRKSAGSGLLALFVAASGYFCAAAQEPKPPSPPPATAAKDNDRAADKEPPLPADAHVEQTIQLNGSPLRYTVAVGTLPVYAKD